jgi:beta-glucosidase
LSKCVIFSALILFLSIIMGVPENTDTLDFTLEKPLDLVGTATSDWQLNPENENSDWGYELAKKQQGKKTGIAGVSDPELLPRFDDEYRHILPRGKEIGSNSFRMSFDFAELCPEKGVFNEEKMAHYARVLARCHALGMEPMVTLNHWTLPKSFAKYDQHDRIKKGPLENPRIVDHFAFYVNNVADFLFDPQKIRAAVREEGYDKNFVDQLCDERLICRWFISLNEPVNMIFTPYMVGEFPPHQKLSIRKYPKLRNKAKKMHEISYDTLHNKATVSKPHNVKDGIKVGMAHNVTGNTRIAPYEYYANWGLAERMEEGADSDFMGIQYYFRIRLGLNGIKGPDSRYHSDHSQFGQVYPAGIYDVLKFASEKWPNRELVLSEFGFADKTDRKRPDWILETVYHLIRAKREGVNVTGALLWSLINNFEWCKGMDTPFGLYDIHGQPLQSDDEETDHVSSREVWTASSKYLTEPTSESAQKLTTLRLRTKAQLDRSVALVCR